MVGLSDAQRRHQQKVIRYYKKTESLVGYRYLMSGTKHFGYYEPGSWPFPFEPALRRMEQLLAQRLDVGSTSVVLDAGCGMGVVACEIASLTECRVEGIDILDFNIKEATERAAEMGLSERTHFQIMDYSGLDFPDKYFDAVYTCETLVHAQDPRSALQEFRRVLKPGGRLVMLEYSRSSPETMPSEANRAFERVNTLAAMPAFQEVFIDDALPEILKESGWHDVESWDLTNNVFPMLRAFRFIAIAPYELLNLLGKEEKAVNAMSAVEFYRYRKFFKYWMYKAVK